MIISKVIKDYKAVQMRLRTFEKDGLDYVKLENQFAVLHSLYGYIMDGSWVKSDKVRSKLRYLISIDMNYVKFMDEFGMTNDAARSFMFRVNKSLSDILGEENVNKIKEGNYDDMGLFMLRYSDELYKTYFNDWLVSYLPKPMVSSEIDIKDCGMELKFLEIYCRSVIQKRMQLLDQDKLKHILGLLGSEDPAHVLESVLINDMLKGDITTQDILGKLEKKYKSINDFK